jgi:hypothetical protein
MKNQDSTSKDFSMTRLSRHLLKEISNNLRKVGTLDTLIEILESTNDPDPSELYLLESLYKLQENIKVIESRLNNYLLNSNTELLGNRLNDLYNRKTSIGSSKIFND